MKKKIVYSCILMILFMMTITGCAVIRNGIEEKLDNKREKQEIENGIDRIEVYTSAENPLDVYHVRYPFHYYVQNGRSMKLIDLQNVIEPEELDAEKEQWLIDYVKNLPEAGEEDFKAYTQISYQIIMSYNDENGETEYVYKYGYRDYPEGWREFVSRYNEACGEDVLTDSEKYQEITPEFLTEQYGITDEDVPDGDLERLIENQKLDIVKLNSIKGIDSFITAYYASINEYKLEEFKPKELISRQSTEAEYENFIQEYLKKIGYTSQMETESDQKYFRLFRNEEKGSYLYIGKTEDIEKMPVQYDNVSEEYELFLDAHMEDMTFCTSFLYSQDGKYLLTSGLADTDEQLAFVEINCEEIQMN